MSLIREYTQHPSAGGVLIFDTSPGIRSVGRDLGIGEMQTIRSGLGQPDGP